MKSNKIKKYQKSTLAALLMIFSSNMAFALDASNCINHTSGVNPVTNGAVTTITTTNNIDTFQWNQFNVGSNETAFFQFTQNGQTAVNYLDPRADVSAIFGAIKGSTILH
ncbi:MAG: hypothetical protein PHX18_00905 [Candidatus Gastranaerophilales bacterium]|nr:hypothetical protein [Candidatus Gastranaerophilales bacterium]